MPLLCWQQALRVQLCGTLNAAIIFVRSWLRCRAALAPNAVLCMQARDSTQWLPMRTQPAPGGAEAKDAGAGVAELEERVVEFDDVRECLLTLGMPPASYLVACMHSWATVSAYWLLCITK